MLLFFTALKRGSVLVNGVLVVAVPVETLAFQEVHHVDVLIFNDFLANGDGVKGLVNQIKLVGDLCNAQIHNVCAELHVVLTHLFEIHQTFFVVALVLFDLAQPVDSTNLLIWVLRVKTLVCLASVPSHPALISRCSLFSLFRLNLDVIYIWIFLFCFYRIIFFLGLDLFGRVFYIDLIELTLNVLLKVFLRLFNLLSTYSSRTSARTPRGVTTFSQLKVNPFLYKFLCP